MKYTPQQYAQALIEGLKEKDCKKIAAKFWQKLQENNQYGELSKIIESIDEEYARISNKVLARVYSSKELTEKEIKNVESKINKRLKKEVFLKQIIKNNVTGLIVKVDDKEIDLSLEGRINSLGQALIDSREIV